MEKEKEDGKKEEEEEKFKVEKTMEDWRWDMEDQIRFLTAARRTESSRSRWRLGGIAT